MMDIQTQSDLETLFKIAAQAEKLRSKDGSFPAFILQDDIKIMRYVIDVLLPRIKDVRSRRIIWLRSQGECWKKVGVATNLANGQVKRIYQKELKRLIMTCK